jgi:hypothetical protein
MRFRDLPMAIQAGFGLVLLNSWILFEETIVERTSLARLLPNYQAGFACVWDAGAVIVIAGVVMFLRSRR